MMCTRVRAFTLLLFVALCFQKLPAQVNSSGSIAGQVADSSGAVITKATVIAVQTQTNQEWKALSDSLGNYIFPNLPNGIYSVTAQKEGFSKQQVNGITLNAGDSLRKNIVLVPGAVTDTIEVSSDTISVDTQTGNVGDVITAKTIESMPLVTRNFIELVELAPGVSSDIGSEPGFASNAGLYASFNGVRNTSNNWTIDGVPDQDVYYGNNAIVPDVDALAEFRMDRGNYSAEQGRTAGATINAILKQGTNQFHGTAFEFMRNGALNANNYFSNLDGVARPNEHYNNWGYTVGGPIKKDKLFFFWSEEWRHIIEPSGTAEALVPTDQEKAGDFSDYAALQLPEPVVTTALAANPLCAGCVAGQPFPGGVVNGVTETQDVIPAGLLNSNSQALLNTYYPTAQKYNSATASNYSSSDPTRTTVREELIRLDYNISDNWKVYAHYIQDQNHIASPYSLWNDNALPNVAASKEFEPLQSFALNLVGTITPNLINEVQFGIYHDIIRINMGPNISRDRATGLDIPYYFANHTNADNRIPNLSFMHYSGIVSDWPFLNGFFYHKWSDNLSWHKGNHNYKLGLLVIQQGKNENNQNSGTNGGFYWAGTAAGDGIHTGNDLADMITGFADTYSETQTNPMQHLRYWDVESYVQDQWQIAPRLNLTFGLRYTYYGPEIDQNNLNTNFLSQLYSAALAPTVNNDGTLSNIPLSQMSNGVYMPTNGIIIAGVNSPYGDAVHKTNKLNLAPRIGFSYDVFGTGKSAIRGGYGIYYDRTAPYELGGKSNPPFNSSITLNDVSVSKPRSGSSVFSPVGVTALSPKYSIPYNQQWSFGVQQELHRNTVLAVDYVGTKETHMLYVNQLNQNQPSAAVAQGSISYNALRPYLGYSAISQYTPESSSNYHGLQASLKEQLGSAFTLNVSYTWSKVLTNSSSDGSSPQNSYNLKADRGPATFDKSQMLVVNYVWQLPTLANHSAAVRGALGGWNWSGIASVNTGEPITVTLNVWANSGVVDSTQRPNISGKAQDGKMMNDWLNVNAFSIPDQGTFGNSGVGIARLPRTTQVDSSLYKDFHIYNQLHMQFRLEAINALNHTLFNGVNSSYYDGNPQFGHVTSATAPRVAQAGVHFNF
jgi:hypothetical protein